MRKIFQRYGAAAFMVVVPLLINLNLGIFRESALLLFFTGVILSAMYLGTGPTIMVIVSSLLLEDYFFVGSTRHLHISVHYIPRLIVFCGVSLLVGTLVKSRNKAEAQLKQLAWYDSLTGLARRNQLQERFTISAAVARRRGQRVALLFLDADNFKEINDTCGHHCGDELLKQIAARLSGIVRKGDTAARLGGDEFVVLLTEIQSPTDAETAALHILDTLRWPYHAGRQVLRVTFSCGLALFPDLGEELDYLIKKADAAMYRAKNKGKNTYCIADTNDQAVIN